MKTRALRSRLSLLISAVALLLGCPLPGCAADDDARPEPGDAAVPSSGAGEVAEPAPAPAPEPAPDPAPEPAPAPPITIPVDYFAPGPGGDAPIGPDQLAELSGAITAFSHALFAELAAAADPDANLVVSPISVWRLGVLAWAGAAGQTREELAAAFRIPDGWSERDVLRGYDALVETMGAIELRPEEKGTRPGLVEIEAAAPRFAVADRLWRAPSIELTGAFARLLTDLDITVDGGEPDDAATRINAWVREQTNGLVPTIVTPPQLEPPAILAMVNACRFEGQWRHLSRAGDTRAREFTTRSGSAIQAPMMRHAAKFPHRDDEIAEVVALPIFPRGFDGVFVLPAEQRFNDVQRRIGADRSGAIWQTEPCPEGVNVVVELPKFEVAADLKLNAALQALGATTAFTPAADFRRLTPTRPAFLSESVQQTRLTVDETGVEAAAASANIYTYSRYSSVKDLAFDRPFFFAIRHSETNTVLFIGRLMEPREFDPTRDGLTPDEE
jgi:serine protease inhibitor